MRTVTQISSHGEPRNEDGVHYTVTVHVALCDDGTMWRKVDDYPWVQLEAIPGGDVLPDDFKDIDDMNFDDFPSEPGPFDYLVP